MCAMTAQCVSVCYRTMGSPLSESPSEKERSTMALY